MRNSITELIESEEDRFAFNQRSNSKIEVFKVGVVSSAVTPEGFDLFSGDKAEEIGLYIAYQNHYEPAPNAQGKVKISVPVTYFFRRTFRERFVDTPYRVMYIDDYDFASDIIENVSEERIPEIKLSLINFDEIEDQYDSYYDLLDEQDVIIRHIIKKPQIVG